MNLKKVLFVSLVLISFIHTLTCFAVDVNAVTYDIDVDEDDSFEWEVKEIDPVKFEKIFGYEPKLSKGDDTKRTIKRIDESTIGWKFTVEVWDFKSDFGENGTISYLDVPDSPSDYDENIFIPTPVNDFLTNAKEDLGSEYEVRGQRIIRTEAEYVVEKEYDSRGVLVSEKYTATNERIILEIVGKFGVVPSANVELILGFIALAVVAIIIVKIRAKKILISD